MKKIFLILFLLISVNAFSQGFKKFDSLYTRAINSTGYYLNGVLQSFGGSGTFDSTVWLSTYHTYTKNFGMTNTFGFDWTNSSLKSQTDTIVLKNKATIFKTNYSHYLMKLDSLIGMQLYKNLIVSGSITAQNNLILTKGSNSWIYTSDNYALYLGTNSDTAMKIDSLNSARFFENVSIDGNLDVSGTIGGVDLNAGSINATSINLTSAVIDDGSQISLIDGSNITSGTIKAGRVSDSVLKISTFDTTKNFYRRDTVGYFNRYNLDTTRFVDFSDTARYSIKDSLKTNNVKSVSNFWNIISFYATANINAVFTFVTSPVFSAVVDFANGITAAYATISGALQVNGNTRLNGYVNGYRDTTVTKKLLNNGGSFIYVRAGFTTGRITGFQMWVWEDSTGSLLPLGYNRTAGLTVGTVAEIIGDSIKYFTNTTSANIGNNTTNCPTCTSNDSIRVRFFRRND